MNGHDSTREQNMEARMTLAAARRGLAAAINDAENGIGHLSCDDPKIMEQVRAHWRRLYATYMNADASHRGPRKYLAHVHLTEWRTK